MSPALVIRLLGRFEVEREGSIITSAEWHGQKTRDLLKILILAQGHYVATDQLCHWLWPEAALDSAQTNLRAVVSDLRKILEPALMRGRDSRYILTRHEGYAFAVSPDLSLDLTEFERLASSTSTTDLEAALALYRGDLLEEDLYAEWATAERERLRILYLRLLARLGDTLFKDSAYTQCIAVCEQALARDSTLESVWRTLMRAQAANGERATALATFDRCRAALSRELGVDPTPETVALHTELLRADAPSSTEAIVSSPTSTPTLAPTPHSTWLNRLGALGFGIWALVTGTSLALSVAGLLQGTLVSSGDPGQIALPYLLNHPEVLADLNQHLYLYFPTGWLLLPGYLAWFRFIRRQAQPETLAWLGLSAGLVDSLSQTIAQSLGFAQLAVFPAAYLTASVSQQATLITLWDVFRQLASIAGLIGLFANPLTWLLLLGASRLTFSKVLIGSGVVIVLLSLAYYVLPDSLFAFLLGLGSAFALRLWLIVLAIKLWRV